MKVYCGLDWSQDKHDLCLLNETGELITHLTITATPDGFEQLEQVRRRLGTEPGEWWIGLETAHNLVIDFLWGRQYEHVFVIPPNAVKSARRRYRQTNAPTDQTDAYVLADMLRTDQARLQPWHPDSELTQRLRATVSLLGFLTRESVRTRNRLAAVLIRYYPLALHLFSAVDYPVALAFIQAYPTPAAAQALRRPEFEAFLKAHAYRQNTAMVTRRYAHVQQTYPTATPATVAAYQAEAQLLARHLGEQLDSKRQQVKSVTPHTILSQATSAR